MNSLGLRPRSYRLWRCTVKMCFNWHINGISDSNDHIAWCGALRCRRIAIIVEGEGPVCGREGWHRVGGGLNHGTNAVMVVGDIRVMSHQKVKRGQHIFYPPAKAMAALTNPLGTQSEVDSLSGVRTPRDESGPVRTKQGPEKTNQSLAGWNEALRDEPGP